MEFSASLARLETIGHSLMEKLIDSGSEPNLAGHIVELRIAFNEELCKLHSLGIEQREAFRNDADFMIFVDSISTVEEQFGLYNRSWSQKVRFFDLRAQGIWLATVEKRLRKQIAEIRDAAPRPSGLQRANVTDFRRSVGSG